MNTARSHRPRRLSIPLMAAALCILNCGKDKRVEPTPEESLKATQSMVDWLECEECEEGQLEATLKHGELLRPLYLSALKSGPAPASRELYRRELEKRFDELTAYGQTHPGSKPTLPKDEYVALYLGNYDALYRVRAAQALAKIGGRGVKEEMKRVMDTVKREDVKAALTAALGSMR